MDAITLLGLALLLSLTLYALLGGADYGGGLWDLLASGPTADRQRATIARAIGPVWEANHVWLILAIVLLFTGFPRAFSAISTFLHIPLVLVLVGIVMRGSAFVFRAYGSGEAATQRLWGRVFAIASIVTPLFLGITVGAVTDGRLPERADSTFIATFIAPWLTPFSVSIGVFALTMFAFLAAVYLTLEARDPEEQAAFRARALFAGIAVALLAGAALLLAAPDVRAGLLESRWAIPLHLGTGTCALVAFAALWRRRYAVARLAAAAQVTCILWGWALAQYPFAIRPHLTLADAAAPAGVIALVLRVLVVGAVVVVPSVIYLFRIFGPRGQR